MSEKIITRPWTEEEDRLLREGVALHGEQDNWRLVSNMIPGRSNKACRKRWLHSLKPDVKKTAWEPGEDQRLIELFDRLGPKWSAIAREIPGRTDDACSKRYREALDPNLKKDPWTPEEDRIILAAHSQYGKTNQWTQVGLELRRSSLACRNRFRLLERRKSGKMSQTASPAQAVVVNELPLVVDQPSEPAIVDMPLLPDWPPYFPPEAYSTFTDDGEHRGSSFFVEPPPDIFEKADPEIAPFKPSSSSLSAALSDPPRVPRPLPPISVNSTPETRSQDIPHNTERHSSLSPLTQCNAMPEMNDILVSLDDFSQAPMPVFQQPHFLNIPDPQPYSFDLYNSFGHIPDIYSTSPISIPSELTQPNDVSSPSFLWKPRIQESEFDSPRSAYDGSIHDIPDDYSSTASTPYFASSALSPSASPLPETHLDLPSPPEQPSTRSLLFSASMTTFFANSDQRRKYSTSKPGKPSSRVQARLSSNLPLSDDPNIKPYACGRAECWPAGEPMSRSCFTTSGELLDHSRDDHPNDGPSDKPYRCGLKGCDKSWKSINGLQYHLQVSTEHFTTALFDRLFTVSRPGTSGAAPGSRSKPDAGKKSNTDPEPERKFVCPRPGCYKAYRQQSGLRYHMNFGHPPDMPTQVQEVPPAIESQLPNKAKKLRPKSLSRSVPS
ncbi:hypothetical protein CPC08DRAFT_746320 [Agrocybe pediades]|nr:hypothetical protein CPC08DRAFT_746320 [Agrocybe pediades]